MADTPASLAALFNTLAADITAHIGTLSSDNTKLKALATRVNALGVIEPPPPPPPPPPSDVPKPSAGMPPVGTVMTGDLNLSGKSNFVVVGVTFNGGRVDAAGSSGGMIYGCTFNDQPSRGLEGSAVNMSGSTGLTVKNCDFNRSNGNCIGQYAPGNLTLDGNHFVGCFSSLSCTVGGAGKSDNLKVVRNVFTGFIRTAIEIAPDEAPGTLNNLLIDNNFFDDVDPRAGTTAYATGPISVVTRHQTNSRIVNNFLRRGTRYNPPSGYYGAIEINSDLQPPEVSGNLIVDFPTEAYTVYGAGGNIHDNRLFNTGGGRPQDIQLTTRPAVPAWPARA